MASDVQNFDKLNRVRSMPFEDYFAPMGIPEEEKKKRIALAEDWDDVLMYILALFDIEDENKQKMASESLLKNQLEEGLLDATSKHGELDEYVQENIHNIADEIITTTLAHIDEPYYLSEDRMHFIAEDQANAFGNYFYYEEASKKYSYKIWMTMADEKVRKTHNEIDGMMIEMEDAFHVGDSYMRFPHDTSLGANPKEYINCRCFLLFR